MVNVMGSLTGPRDQYRQAVFTVFTVFYKNGLKSGLGLGFPNNTQKSIRSGLMSRYG